ncbi:MAG: hypothetical protein F9K40_01805 [Kofleriaceae bacterium]|nr:MAG: hypothetical protein F9K40_01805 [Kofleriaceae bacterium]
MSTASAGIFLVVAFGVATPAHAQPASVQAEQLFRQGKKLMGEGKIAEACKAFEGSYRKDEAVSTLLNLADCREKNKQYASAWGYFLDAERTTRGDASQATFNRTARERAKALEAKLSYLIINVPAESNIEGLAITRNGLPVDEAEWNTDIPVDGGDYVIEGKAPGYEAWSTKISVAESGDKESVNVPKFRQRPTAPTDKTPDDVVVRPRLDPTPDAPPVSSSRKTVGKITIAGGGALVLGGLAVGYMAQQKWSEAKDVCGADLVCDSAGERMTGQELVDAARFRGNLSTILTGAGIATVGVGVVLWVTAPKKESRRGSIAIMPSVSPEGVALAIGGAL